MERSMIANNKSVDLKNIVKMNLMDSNTLILCIIGFLLSRAMVVDNIAPLGVAFFLCVSRIDKYKLPVFISTLAGTLLSFNQTSNIIKYTNPIITPLDAPKAAPLEIDNISITIVDKIFLIDIPNIDTSPIPIMLKVMIIVKATISSLEVTFLEALLFIIDTP